jgi:predicted Zn-dependent protease
MNAVEMGLKREGECPQVSCGRPASVGVEFTDHKKIRFCRPCAEKITGGAKPLRIEDGKIRR